MLTEKERQWIECHFTKLNELVTLLRIDVAKLKVKSGIWGVIGGSIPVIAYFLIKRI
jgi:hypothetical protein